MRLQVNSPSLPTPPTNGLAFGEVHDSITTVLNTRFDNVQWVDGNNNWHYFNQANWNNNPPYHAGGLYDWDFAVWGPN
jgi:ABC-type enterochelin transport system permease subunit